MWSPGQRKSRQTNPKIPPQKLFDLRKDAGTGRYTLTELAVLYKMSYGHVMKLCRGISVKEPHAMGGPYNIRDRNPAPPITVEQAIQRRGNDDDFEASNTKDWYPVSHRPGSLEKIHELRRRADEGMPLWHPHDYTSIGGSGSFCGFDGPAIRICPMPGGGKGLE
jgi:hypothetical protein